MVPAPQTPKTGDPEPFSEGSSTKAFRPLPKLGHGRIKGSVSKAIMKAARWLGRAKPKRCSPGPGLLREDTPEGEEIQAQPKKRPLSAPPRVQEPDRVQPPTATVQRRQFDPFHQMTKEEFQEAKKRAQACLHAQQVAKGATPNPKILANLERDPLPFGAFENQ